MAENFLQRDLFGKVATVSSPASVSRGVSFDRSPRRGIETVSPDTSFGLLPKGISPRAVSKSRPERSLSQKGVLPAEGVKSGELSSGAPDQAEVSAPGNGPLFEDFSVPFTDDFLAVHGRAVGDRKLRLRRTGPADAPAILVLGGISAGRGAATVGDEIGWWPDIVGSGKSIDTDRYAVWTADYFPIDPIGVASLAPTDFARQFVTGLRQLGVTQVAGIVGASFGGMVALAIAEKYPAFVDKLCALCVDDGPSPMSRAFRKTQQRVLQFGLDNGNPQEAVSIARELAVATYRTPGEFEQRFQNPNELYSYLTHHGAKYSATVDAKRYLALSSAIDRHKPNPEQITTPTYVLAVREDQLVPEASAQRLYERLSGAKKKDVISSLYGHDGFLKETTQVGDAIRRFFDWEAV